MYYLKIDEHRELVVDLKNNKKYKKCKVENTSIKRTFIKNFEQNVTLDQD